MGHPGSASAEATASYGRRHTGLAAGHFRQSQSLTFSSIGLGSYLGNEDDSTDRSYSEAVLRALEMGCNHYDTAINYRGQRSERAFATAFTKAFHSGKVSRQEIVVATKGGYLNVDSRLRVNPRKYFQEVFIDSGICKAEEIVANCHCIAPNYLRHQLRQSLENLGLETIDIYYLHNPETQLSEVQPAEFINRMRRAFETLEEAVSEGKIQYYGTATWNGYRVDPRTREYISVSELTSVAESIAGNAHHFRFIQLPYNLAMPEAFVLENQMSGNRLVSLTEAAAEHGITVISSASILQRRLAHNLPEDIREKILRLKTDAQRAIQFVRSTPGITSALVGMSRVMHVEENLETAKVAPMTIEEFLTLFSQA